MLEILANPARGRRLGHRGDLPMHRSGETIGAVRSWPFRISRGIAMPRSPIMHMACGSPAAVGDERGAAQIVKSIDSRRAAALRV